MSDPESESTELSDSLAPETMPSPMPMWQPIEESGPFADHPSLELGAVIGHGGTSEVRIAFDHGLRRPVAAKILHERYRSSSRMLNRFLREASITASLEHPNIIPVHNLVRRAGVGHFFTMKMAAGRSLADWVSSQVDVLEEDTLDELITMLIKVCDALSLAHARGVVHLDVKPANILLGEHGEVYLTDWGIARRYPSAPPHTASGARAVSGTPSMLAPEQARCDAVDGRTDVFGVGATLYAVVGRQGPFRRSDIDDCVAHAARCDHPSLETLEPRTPEALAQIVARAMAPCAQDRYPTVQELKRSLERFRRGQVSAPERTLNAGEFLFKEGEPGDRLYFVVEGELEVLREADGVQAVVSMLGTGAVIGELGVLSNAARTASVRARTPARVQMVSAERIRYELRRMPPWMRRVVQSTSDLARRLHEASG